MGVVGWDLKQYQLLDFGHGRKLESFGGVVLDRPSPAAEGKTKQRKNWGADLRLQPGEKPTIELPEISWRTIRFRLKLTPFGHVGLFPEQWHNWDWLHQNRNTIGDKGEQLQALNLFGYTGGTTLALASIGAAVTHVDSSQPAVRWARENAEASGLKSHPIRWIVEDARKYVRREVKRDKCYDIVVLDPPSFGHGTSGDRWEIIQDLPAILEDIGLLLRRSSCPIVIFSAHCYEPNESDVARLIRKSCKHFGDRLKFSNQRLDLKDETGRALDAGFTVRMELAS